jgi:hypothetical protein
LNLESVGLIFLIIDVDSAFELVELGVQLAHLTSRQSQILLGISDFFIKTFVFLNQVVHLLFQEVRLLVVSSDSVLVLVEFRDDFGVLVG